MKKISILIAILFVAIGVFAQTGSFRLPPFVQFKLPNGLTVYLMEQHEVPIINVSGVFPAGAIYDGNKSGLASMTASSLTFGTKNMTKTQIEEQLEFVGASLNVSSSKESASLGARFAAKDQEKVLALIKDVLTQPVFNVEEFEKEKKRKLAALERAKESPRSVIGNYWDQVVYAGHPYANPTSGTPEGIATLTREDVMAFYSRQYVPGGSSIAIVGDFDAQKMKATITKMFGSWKGAVPRVQDLAAAAPAFPQSGGVLLVNKEDARETTLLIGGKGVKRNNPDFVALEVVNTVFGGRFTSMLNDALRVNSGLTYGAGSSFNSYKNAGSFYISTFTATKTSQATIDMALEVLKKLHSDGIDQETLTSAKNYVKGQFPPRYETPGQLAAYLNMMFWYNLDASFIDNFQKEVDGMTVARAKEIITKYYPADKLQFVLVGKAADIRQLAAKYGPVVEKEIKGEKLKPF